MPDHAARPRVERPSSERVRSEDGAGRRRKEFMSYRELSMIDVKELLRRWAAGHSYRQIARETGTDRAAAARYPRWPSSSGCRAIAC